MNIKKKDDINCDNALEALHETFDKEISEHLKKNLSDSLNGFRQDLQEHPYISKTERSGYLKRQELLTFFKPLARPLLFSGIILVCAAIVIFFSFRKEHAYVGGSDRAIWYDIQFLYNDLLEKRTAKRAQTNRILAGIW